MDMKLLFMRQLAIITLIIIAALSFLGCSSTQSGKQAVQSNEAKQKKPEVKKYVKYKSYVLNIGDTLDINVYKQPDLSIDNVQIGPDGKISMPLIGDIQAQGLTIDAIKQNIETALRSYYVKPKVTVNTVQVNSFRCYVLGEVSNPGVYDVSVANNLLQAISNAGGTTVDAKTSEVVVLRNDKYYLVDMKKLFKGDISQNVLLRAGDIIYVPTQTIASVSRFFEHINRIIRPIVSIESAITLAPSVKEAIRDFDDYGKRTNGDTQRNISVDPTN